VGNITGQTGNQVTYGYLGNNTLGSATVAAVTRNYSYDVYGDVAGDGTHTYAYDDAQTLRCVDCAAGSAIHFDYDAKNMRVKRTQGPAISYSIYSAKGDLLTEYDPTSDTYVEYAYVNGKQIARRLQAPKAPSTTQLSATPNPARVGQTVTLNATVTGANPTGTVTFYDGTTALTPTGTVSSGHATWSGSFAAAGTHSLTAKYNGDANNAISQSAAYSETVNVELNTTTTISSSRNPAPYSAQVTFTSTVSNGTSNKPTGTVDFKSGTTVLGSGVVNAAGQATWSTSGLAVGSYQMTASYQGDANNKPSVSSTLTQTITQALTNTYISSSPNPSTRGGSVTFQATITGGSGMTGTVTFYDGASPMGTANVVGGSASFATNALTVGYHSITAQYSGETNFAASQSAAMQQSVEAVASSTVLSSGGVFAIYAGASVTLTATVSGFTPTGQVTFYDGASQLASVPLSNSVAVLTTTALRTGTRGILAVYSGDANNTASSSAISIGVTANVGVYRNNASTSAFYIDYARDGTAEFGLGFGAPGDAGLVGDVLGTGKDAFVVYRNGSWFVDTDWNGSGDYAYGFGGVPGDIPLLADMDGDGKADLVIFRGGNWYVSTNRDGIGTQAYGFGAPGDRPLIADMNGDGRNDLVVFRNGAWYVCYSPCSGVGGAAYSYGTTGDVPLLARWKPSDSQVSLILFRNGAWYISTQRDGTTQYTYGLGAAGDVPLIGAFH